MFAKRLFFVAATVSFGFVTKVGIRILLQKWIPHDTNEISTSKGLRTHFKAVKLLNSVAIVEAEMLLVR